MDSFLAAFIVFAVAMYFAAQMFVRGRLSLITIAVLAALAALLLPGMQYLLAQDLITAGVFFLFLALIGQALLKVDLVKSFALMVVVWLLGALFLRF